MDRLTIEQRVKIIKTYYKSGDSNIATFRALRDDYGRHNRPTKQVIGKIVKKFEEKPLHPDKVTVWCALWSKGVIGPYFFEDANGQTVTVNSE